MLAFLLDFASIGAEEIPRGVLPQKMPERRQLAGTGATSSTTQPAPTTSSTTNPAPQSSTTKNTQNTQTTQSNNPPASSTTNTNTNNDDTTSNQQQPQSTTVPTSVAVTTTNANGDTVTTHVSTNKVKAVSSTKAVQTEKGTDNSVVKVGSKTIDPKTLSQKTTIKQPLIAKETREATLTSIWTSGGQVYSSVYTTENVFKSTTGFATATINPSLANGGGDGSNLSSHTKAIIGGVVGGIGGAILIGGLAFVAWRLWGKKKQEQQDDVYSSSHDSMSWQQKRSSGNTLDTEQYSSRYNNPSGPVNTASNF